METIIVQRTSTNGIDQASATRIHLEDKRLINCRTVDVNQLMLPQYHSAWEQYLNGCPNHRCPAKCRWARVIDTWRSDPLSDGEGLTGNNAVLALFKPVTNPGCHVTEYQSAGASQWD
ncbi:hypothetical protein H7K24_02050 [Mycobacterium fragae]|jgi:ribonucleoside-diphosphate reductase beta chain|uniref:Uncharacterized protein n=1 Tax=Mycobacterium fragae TaxID=1260918 RepID=A0A1X1UFF3_9MYCO|nr:hypothetical protein [Mycobacterium fragae]MCV7398932.1 hypothetical protein [Mycobacterium fragae]ORV55544.1 hypothetical protein AWC06_03850 [Mycobacterium fragae]